jgi:hypothetical protein
MTQCEIDALIEETKAGLQRALDNVKKLKELDSDPHRSMIVPTLKNIDTFQNELEELMKMASEFR